MIRLTVIYVLCFAGALAVTWAVGTMIAIGVLDRPTLVGIVTGVALPPLAGLAVFALSFGLATRRKLGAGFWLAALPITFGPVVVGLGMVFLGFITALEYLILAVSVIFFAGLFAARRSEAA